jgi:hypothetical protein
MKIENELGQDEIWKWIDESFSQGVCNSLRELSCVGEVSIASCLPDALLMERREQNRKYESFLTATFDSNKLFTDYGDGSCLGSGLGGVIDSSWVEDKFGIETRRQFDLLIAANPDLLDIERLQLAIETERQVVNKRYASFLSVPFDSDKLFTALDIENETTPKDGTAEK